MTTTSYSSHIAVLLLIFLHRHGTAAQGHFALGYEQERARCIGVVCPADRPVCILHNHLAVCISDSSSSGQRRVNRLSRAPVNYPQQQPTEAAQQQSESLTGATTESLTPFQNPNVKITFLNQQPTNFPNSRPTAPIPPNKSKSSQSLGGSRDLSDSQTSGLSDIYTAPVIGTQQSSGPNSNPRQETAVGSQRNGSPFNIEVHTVAPDYCFLPSETGKCRGFLSRYFFNPGTGQCQTFIYGGCGGNKNNFQTLVDCFKTCALPQGAVGSSPSVIENGGGNSYQANGDRLPLSDTIPGTVNELGGGNFASIGVNGEINDKANAIFERNLFFAPPENDFFSTITAANGINEGKGPGSSVSSQGKQDRQSESQATLPRACTLDAEHGECQRRLSRIFYNRATGRCELFDYGGCGGNGNNFLTFEDCTSTCNEGSSHQGKELTLSQAPTPRNPLEQNVQSLVGKSLLGQPYINGLNGELNNVNLNANNPSNIDPRQVFNALGNRPGIQDRNVFKDTSNVNMPQSLNTLKAPNLSVQDQREQSERRQVLGGGGEDFANTLAGSSLPIRSSSSQGSRPATCYQPVNPGPCLGAIQRFYFNRTVGQCLDFTYGGCGGNQNNYATRDACARECGGREQSSQQLGGRVRGSPQPSIGRLGGQSSETASVGGNRGVLGSGNVGRRQGFRRIGSDGSRDNIRNQNTGTSQQTPSNYPGSSQSPFRGSQTSQSVVCLLDKFPGPCRALIPRFYYNQFTGRCEQFFYGGCQSNGNNFRSQAECQRVCGNQNLPEPRIISDKDTSPAMNSKEAVFRSSIAFPTDSLPFSSFRFIEGEAQPFQSLGTLGSGNYFW